MHAEKWRFRTLRLNRHQRRPAMRLAIAEHRGELLHGWRLEQDGERKRLSGNLLDSVPQPGSQQRMTAEFEEIVSNADRLAPEQLFPNSDQLRLQRIGHSSLRSRFRRRIQFRRV